VGVISADFEVDSDVGVVGGVPGVIERRGEVVFS